MLHLRRSFAFWITSPAPYLIPVGVLLTIYHELSGSSWHPDQATWAAASARVPNILFLAGALTAGAAAWDMSRLRRAEVPTWAPARRSVVVAATTCAPAIVLGLSCLLTAWLTTLSRLNGVPGSPDLRPMLVAALVVVAHAALGAAAGWRLSSYFAIPLGVVASYAWHVYPRNLDPVWLRHLTGMTWSDCCMVDEMAAPGLFPATVIVAVGGIAAGILLAVYQPRRWQSAGAGALVCVALVGGSVLVDSMGSRPVTVREGQMVCQNGAPMVCVWPESKALLPVAHELSQIVATNLARNGLATPNVAAQRFSGNAAEWPIFLYPAMTEDQLRLSFISGLMPALPSCIGVGTQTGEPYFGYEAAGAVEAWLWLASGGDPEAIPNNGVITEAGVKLAGEVQAQPLTRQQAWLHNNFAAIGGCDIKPDLAAA